MEKKVYLITKIMILTNKYVYNYFKTFKFIIFLLSVYYNNIKVFFIFLYNLKYNS